MKPIIKHTKCFNTIHIEFLFPFKLNTENIADISILPLLLVKTNKQYPTEDSFRKALIDNYIIDIGCSVKTIAYQRFLIFTLIIPDVKTIKEDYTKKSIEFFIKTIYEPNIVNNQFDSKIFEENRQILITRMHNDLKNVDFYNYQQLINLVDIKGEAKKNLVNHQEQLENLNPQTTFQLYQQIVLEKSPYIYVIGDIDDKINDYFDNFRKEQFPIDSDLTYYTPKISDEVVIKEEVKPFFKSCLNYVYNVKNMTKNDIVYLQLVGNLLSSGSSDLLMKYLRHEGKLVYHADSSVFSNYGVLLIEAWIAKSSKEKAMELIGKVMEEIKKRETIEQVLDDIKEENRLQLIRSKDSQISMLNQMIYAENLKVSLEENERYEIIKKVTVDDLLKFIDRLELNVIYYLEGDQSE